MAKLFHIGNDSITCHAFDKDMKHVALSCNSPNIQIYRIENAGTSFTHVAELKRHTMQVTGIDWSKTSNQILSSSADRSAFVWKWNSQKNEWETMYVHLGISKAATCIKWSPNENKFAVGSGSRNVIVCYFDKENDWWLSKQIKKHIRSTVTCIDWHPDNELLACGSTDFKVRIFNAVLKTAGDSKPHVNVWGKETTFGNMLFEVSSSGCGWIHGLAFSRDGNQLAWIGHDSTVCVAIANSADSPPQVCIERTEWLPFLSLLWLTDNCIVCAGHDCEPCLYNISSSKGIVFSSKLNEGGSSRDVTPESDDSGSGRLASSAMAKFMSMDSYNMSANAASKSTKNLPTLHQNTINSLQVYKGSSGNVEIFSSVARDGNIVFWDMMSQKFNKLRI